MGFPSLTILFSYMNSLVVEQVGRVNRNWVMDAVDEVNTTLNALTEAVSWACFNDNVTAAMRLDRPLSSSEMLTIFSAQDSMAAYLAGSPIWTALNKIIVFNDDGVYFEYVKNRSGTLEDLDLVTLRNDFDSIDYVTGRRPTEDLRPHRRRSPGCRACRSGTSSCSSPAGLWSPTCHTGRGASSARSSSPP